MLQHLRDHAFALTIATYTATCEAIMTGYNTWHTHYETIRHAQRRQRNPAFNTPPDEKV